jgi:hypothetical protein
MVPGTHSAILPIPGGNIAGSFAVTGTGGNASAVSVFGQVGPGGRNWYLTRPRRPFTLSN